MVTRSASSSSDGAEKHDAVVVFLQDLEDEVEEQTLNMVPKLIVSYLDIFKIFDLPVFRVL